MSLSGAALGLITTAALLSIVRLPGLVSRKHQKDLVNSEQFHKRYASPYHRAVPTRGPLDRFVNRIFRRPYLADVPPPHYQQLSPYRSGPRWPSRSMSHVFPSASDSHYSYYFGQPAIDRKAIRNSSAKNPFKYLVPYESHPKIFKHRSKHDQLPHNGNQLSGDETFNEHHYYHFDEDDEDDDDEDQDNNSNGDSYDDSAKESNSYEHVEGEKTTESSDNKKDGEPYETDQSKHNYAYYSKHRLGRKHKATGYTTPNSAHESTTTSKDCDPSSKLNYHYHMYFVKPLHKTKNETSKKKHSKKNLTTTTTNKPSVENNYDKYSSISLDSSNYGHKPDADYYYQVVTSRSYVDSAYPMATHSGDSAKKDHFDSDYYNSVLMSKIFGINPNIKAMPIENYATESATKYEYDSSNGVEPHRSLKKDSQSKLYITLDGKSGKSTSNKENGSSKKVN